MTLQGSLAASGRTLRSEGEPQSLLQLSGPAAPARYSAV